MVTLQGLDALADAATEVRRTLERIADFPAITRRAGDALVDWAGRNFEAEGGLLDDFPSGWPALSPRTLAARRRHGGGSRILFQSGRLSRGTQAVPGETSVVVDNPVPYAAVHQLGEGVPRRPVLPDAPQAERIVQAALDDHLKEALP